MAKFNVKLVERTCDATPPENRYSVVTWSTDPAHLHQPGASDLIFDEIRKRRESIVLDDNFLEVGMRLLHGEDPYNRTLYIAGRIRDVLQQGEHTVSLDMTMHPVLDVRELWTDTPQGELV